MLIPSPFGGIPTPVPSNVGILNRWIAKPPPPNAHVVAPKSAPASALGGALNGQLAGPQMEGLQFLPRRVGGQ